MMSEVEARATDVDPLTRVLDELGDGSSLVWIIFLFTMFPTIFAGMHSNTYIFIAENPTHWCAVPELTSANWTSEQIREVSSAGACAKYDYNYSLLAEIGFAESRRYVAQRIKDATTLDCTGHNYADDTDRTSMVQEWDLVCKDAPKRATTHMALSLGKLLGAGFLGVSADKYGRRSIYVLGIFMFIVAGPASAYVPWYWGFVCLRLLTGVSFSAIQFSSLTTLTEVAGNTHRQWMAVAFNCGFASGPIIVAGVAYLSWTWRQIQVATSLPALVLLLFAWLMPESPRWLIAQGRRKEARRVLERFNGPIKDDYELPRTTGTGVTGKTVDGAEEKKGLSLWSDQMRGLKVIFGCAELRLRMFITCFTWLTASLTYYALALNVDNIAVDYYLFAVLQGVTEIPAYLVPTPILIVMGRRQASSMLFVLSGALLMAILSISRSNTAVIVAATLVSRFALSAAYGVIILYTSEFFPTVSRNSALGVSSAMAHVGSIVAPYSVVSLGNVVWWGPSTFCGILVLGAGVACRALPETRNRPLADTVQEELAEGRGSVSLGCKCSR
ncbi:organic cation transporter protein [Copidosoma floridanum]|uniref:organic cation transporter protein n=1 Tax=Copidosoma floridanum TaxID=29053 RepID=UPI0006C9DB00|nr:organic cation transporter protein [Copidosoma floridanum]